MSAEKNITLLVNGEEKSLPLEPSRTLLRALRKSLGLTGAKKSCDNEGTCGACMVIVDGEAVPACTIPLGEMDGRRVETIEGCACLPHESLRSCRRADVARGHSGLRSPRSSEALNGGGCRRPGEPRGGAHAGPVSREIEAQLAPEASHATDDQDSRLRDIHGTRSSLS